MHHSQLPKDVESLKRDQYLCCCRLKIAQPLSSTTQRPVAATERTTNYTRSHEITLLSHFTVRSPRQYG